MRAMRKYSPLAALWSDARQNWRSLTIGSNRPEAARDE